MKHFVVLKDGDILTGEVLEKKFSIKTDNGELTFDIDRIAHIRFQNPPQSLQDEMVFMTGETLRGHIFPQTIGLKPSSSTQVIEIEKEDLHTIKFVDTI